MSYEMYPIKIEGNDTELGMGLFIIEAVGPSFADVQITAPCNVMMWDKISPMIRQALVDMKFEGDAHDAQG